MCIRDRVLTQEAFADLYRPEWGNALCEDRKNLDVLGVGAYDGSTLVGLAACSADCDDMWQIGVDVLPEYRRQGIASALTSRLTKEIINRGKVPFYCTAWSNAVSYTHLYAAETPHNSSRADLQCDGIVRFTGGCGIKEQKIYQ